MNYRSKVRLGMGVCKKGYEECSLHDVFVTVWFMGIFV